jgi:pyrroloquinoline quinone (PQQ) biosynthesis protein C
MSSDEEYKLLDVFDAVTMEWPEFIHKLRVFLGSKDLDYILQKPLGEMPDPEESKKTIEEWNKSRKDDLKVQSYILNKVKKNMYNQIKAAKSAYEMVEIFNK